MATDNYGWILPTPGGSTNTWGGILNDAIEDIDDDLKAVSDAAVAAAGVAAGAATNAGAVTSKAIDIHASAAFYPNEPDSYGGPVVTAKHLSSGRVGTKQDEDRSYTVMFPVTLPNGVTLQSWALIVNPQSGPTVTAQMYYVDTTTGSRVAVGSSDAGSAGRDILSQATLAHAYSSGRFYYVSAFVSGSTSTSVLWEGLEIVYDCPDARKTI